MPGPESADNRVPAIEESMLSAADMSSYELRIHRLVIYGRASLDHILHKTVYFTGQVVGQERRSCREQDVGG